MKKNVNRVLAASAAVVVLAVAAAFVWIEAGPRAHLPSVTDSQAIGMADSSRYVSASVAARDHHAELTLHIATDWHVNANPASLESLIPTTLTLQGEGASHDAQAVYPPGRNSGIVIDGKDIQVYEDGTVIPFTAPSNLKSYRVVVHVQACSTQGICLPPANVVASMDTT